MKKLHLVNVFITLFSTQAFCQRPTSGAEAITGGIAQAILASVIIWGISKYRNRKKNKGNNPTNLILLLLSSSILLSCNRRNIDPNRNNDNDSFRYEVISSNPWSGNYIASDGGIRQVQNKQSGWSYSGLPKYKPFVTQLFAYVTEHPTDVVLNIYYNNSIVASDTVTIDNRTANSTILSYVIR